MERQQNQHSASVFCTGRQRYQRSFLMPNLFSTDASTDAFGDVDLVSFSNKSVAHVSPSCRHLCMVGPGKRSATALASHSYRRADRRTTNCPCCTHNSS